MENLIDTLQAWHAAGYRVALATVVSTWGSSPRRPGSIMAVRDDGLVEGSVSAGCIDGAAAAAAQEALADGRARLLAFGGQSEEGVWDVDLPCGGEAQILVEPLDGARLEAGLVCAREARATGKPTVRVVELTEQAVAGDSAGAPCAVRSRVFSDGDPEDGMGELDARAASRALAHFDHESHAGADPEPAGIVAFGGTRYFVQRMTVAPRLVCVGATHIAQVLVELAAAMGWRAVVVDPRAAFARAERFPRAERVLADWPQRALPGLAIDADTAVCALTHDEKIDVPALDAALDTPAFYIGCLGRPSTQLERRGALLGLGRTPCELARICGPIGIWTGGRRPEDIALSALGQIAAARNGTLERLGAASDRRLSQMDDAYVRAYDARPRGRA